MLGYTDVTSAASSLKGLKDPSLTFEVVSAAPDESMPKGLFIPTAGRDLFEAIDNGAVASFWKKDDVLPAWLPNHFPLFITDNIIEAVLTIMDDYYYNTKQEEWGTMTKFIFRDQEKGKLYQVTNQHQYMKSRDIAVKSLLMKGGE
ncbi:hypothetical protein ACOJQI_07360 [Bacillus salacetis]|uniref:hypothetical protein n=1 Tax=Bacillus salacetis TaxID=2315464 RepID=UPI003BA2393E